MATKGIWTCGITAPLSAILWLTGCNGCTSSGTEDAAGKPPAADGAGRAAAAAAATFVPKPSSPNEALEYAVFQIRQSALQARELGRTDAFDESRRKFQNQVDTSADEAFPQVLLGYVHLYGPSSSPPDAKRRFETATRLEKSGEAGIDIGVCRAWAYYGLAQVAAGEKLFRLAHAELERARKLVPDYWLFLALEGQFHGLQGAPDKAEAAFEQAHGQGRGKFQMYREIAEYYLSVRRDAVRAARWWDLAREEITRPFEQFLLHEALFWEALQDQRWDEALNSGEMLLSLVENDRPVGDPERRAQVVALLVKEVYLPRATQDAGYYDKALSAVTRIEAESPDALTGDGSGLLQRWWQLHFGVLDAWKKPDRAELVRAFLQSVLKAAPRHPDEAAITRILTQVYPAEIRGDADPLQPDLLDDAWFRYEDQTLSLDKRLAAFSAVVSVALDRRGDPERPVSDRMLERLMTEAQKPDAPPRVRRLAIKVLADYGGRGRGFQDEILALLRREMEVQGDRTLIANCTQSLMYLWERGQEAPKLAQVLVEVLKFAVRIDEGKAQGDPSRLPDVDSRELAYHASVFLNRLYPGYALPYGTLDSAQERAEAAAKWERAVSAR